MFTNGMGDVCSISGRVLPKYPKMVLDVTLDVTLSNTRSGSKVKW